MTLPTIIYSLNGMFSLFKYGLSDCNDGFARDPGHGQCVDDGSYERSIGRLFYEPTGATLSEQATDLALLLTAGRLSDHNIGIIVDACSAEPDQASQVRCLQQLIVTTGEFQTTNSAMKSGDARPGVTAVTATDPSEPYKALIFYYKSGGVDSFNLLAPHTCSNDVYDKYRVARGKSDASEGIGLPLSRLLEISANTPLQPCSSFGIHENMPILKDLYDAGDLTFISNAGLIPRPVNTDNYKEDFGVRLFAHNHSESMSRLCC